MKIKYKSAIPTSITIIMIIFSIAGCDITDTNNRGNGTCSNNECIKKFCPDYQINNNSSEDETICPMEGLCSLPDMPMTFQLENGIPWGEIACGPTSVKMMIDTAISNTNYEVQGWSKEYSQINDTEDPTSSSISVCKKAGEDCRKVTATGTKLLSNNENTIWGYGNLDYKKQVYTSQINEFLENRVEEFSPLAEIFTSEDYTEEITDCSFLSGKLAITNKQYWNNIILYLKYKISVTDIYSDNDGSVVTEVNLMPSESNEGHYILMNGYEATDNDVMFKFHDPWYGYKWYAIRDIEINTKTCVKWKGKYEDNECSQYIVFNNLPPNFSNNIAYLVEFQGEEILNNNYLKVIVYVGSITPE